VEMADFICRRRNQALQSQRTNESNGASKHCPPQRPVPQSGCEGAEEKVKWEKIILLIVAIFAFSETARACEPVLPFMKVVAGPAVLMGSWILLLAVVSLKSIIFSFLQKQLHFFHALLLMFIGNILTTVIGVIAAAMIGSGPIIVIGFLVVWMLCVIPARRFLAATKTSWLKRFTPGAFAALMALALVISCILFAVSDAFMDHFVIYWIWKLVAVYLALIVSIVLTAFWEEWVVWKLSRCPADYAGYVQPVIRANLIVLFCIMLIAAIVMLPQRLKSPNFLVRLGLVLHTKLEAKK
jgi:hypothetical protein